METVAVSETHIYTHWNTFAEYPAWNSLHRTHCTFMNKRKYSNHKLFHSWNERQKSKQGTRLACQEPMVLKSLQIFWCVIVIYYVFRLNWLLHHTNINYASDVDDTSYPVVLEFAQHVSASTPCGYCRSSKTIVTALICMKWSNGAFTRSFCGSTGARLEWNRVFSKELHLPMTQQLSSQYSSKGNCTWIRCGGRRLWYTHTRTRTHTFQNKRILSYEAYYGRPM